MSEIATQEKITIPIKLKNDTAWTQKLTKAKKMKVLENLLENGYNISRAAASVGVTRMAITKCMEADAGFADAMGRIKDAHLDQLEETSFIVGNMPSREGFQDRKLLLQSHRRKTYGDKVQIDQTVQVTQTTAIVHIDAVLGSIPTIDAPKSLPSSQAQALPASSQTVEDVVPIEVIPDSSTSE